jgi:hypothetical protein
VKDSCHGRPWRPEDPCGDAGAQGPSPIRSGRASTWVGAVVYALGQVSFLFDSATKPYATADDLSAAFGVAKSTLSAKAKQVRDLTKRLCGWCVLKKNGSPRAIARNSRPPPGRQKFTTESSGRVARK